MTQLTDDMAPDGTPQGDDMLAAEYVLGVPSLADRLAFEARLRTDPALPAMVTIWENHFAGLDAAFAPVPAPDLLPRIEARLFPLQPASGTSRLSSFWPRLIGGLVLAGVVVVAVLSLQPDLAPGTPDMVATLAGEGQALVFTASYDADTDALTVTRTAGPVAAAGQDYELWVIGASGVPVSLGVMQAGIASVTLADLRPDFVLAVSLEAVGGSTTGAPATVLVTGAVTAL